MLPAFRPLFTKFLEDSEQMPPDPEILAYLTHAAISGTMMSSIAYNKPPDFDHLMEVTKYMVRRVFAPDESQSEKPGNPFSGRR